MQYRDLLYALAAKVVSDYLLGKSKFYFIGFIGEVYQWMFSLLVKLWA